MSPSHHKPGFAAETDVPVERSKAQIEGLLAKHGAGGFHTGWQAPTAGDPGWDAVEFLWKDKQIRFRLARPRRDDPRVLLNRQGLKVTDAQLEQRITQHNRTRWRVLFLVIKAKLEAVEAGVVVFEEEFLPFIVTEGGRTVGEILVPRLTSGKRLELESGKP